MVFGLGTAQQVVDQRFWMDFFLNVKRRRIDHEVRPILLVLAAPYQLRVQIAIAAFVCDFYRGLMFLLHHGLKFRSRNIPALCLIVGERLH